MTAERSFTLFLNTLGWIGAIALVCLAAFLSPVTVLLLCGASAFYRLGVMK